MKKAEPNLMYDLWIRNISEGVKPPFLATNYIKVCTWAKNS